MNTIKLFSVVVVITVNLNSLKVESASTGSRSSGYAPSLESDSNPSIASSMNVPSGSLISETEDDHCVPVPTSILLKLVTGESLSDSDHTRLCSILYRVAGGLIAQHRNVQSPAHTAAPDQVVPRRSESVESRIAGQLRSSRVYCPTDDEAQSNPQNGGFFVQSTRTGNGLEVLDRDGQRVATINTSERCATNPTDN